MILNRSFISFVLLGFLLLGSLVRAEDWDAQHEAQEHQLQDLAYPEIERALKALRGGPRLAEKCDEPIQHNCTFSSYCQNFKGQTDSIYLYENKQGQRIPNLPLLAIYNTVAQCATGLRYDSLTEDPFLHPNKFLETKNKNKWKSQKNRIDKIYQETRARFIDILQRRKDGKNNQDIDAMILRVSTVKLKMPDAEVFADLAGSGCEYPNAYYFPGEHAFTVCPQLGNFPDASLMSTISHELAHAIDPCHCAQDLVKTTSGYVTDYAFDSKAMAQKGRVAGEVAAKGLTLPNNPLASVISCLQKPSSIAVKMPTAQEIKKSYLESSNGIEDQKSLFAQKSGQIEDLYPRYGACEFFAGKGHIGEAFADWASAQVLADKIKSIPDSEKAKQFAFESQAVFLSSACAGSFAPIQDKVADAMGNSSGPACGQAFQNMDVLRELNVSHPVSPDRMTKIIYAQPEIQKALGCKPTKAEACQ